VDESRKAKKKKKRSRPKRKKNKGKKTTSSDKVEKNVSKPSAGEKGEARGPKGTGVFRS